MATFYIESGTGKQITDLNQVDPLKTYVRSGDGVTLSGSALKPSTTITPTQSAIPAPQPTAPLPGVVYQQGTETPGGGGTDPNVKLYGGTPVPSNATSTSSGLQVPQTPTPTPTPQPQQPTPQQPTPQAVLPPTTVLQPGSADAANVGLLQDFLVSKGLLDPKVLLNGGRGVYGPLTTAAVAQLQSSLGVDNSTGVGYFGPRTIAALAGKTQTTAPQGGGTQPTTGTDTTSTLGTTEEVGPTPVDSVQTYIKMFADSGLGDIKAKFEQTLQDQEDMTNKMNEEIADVKNNPWYSQGVAEGHVKRIQEKYQSKLETYSNFAKLYQTMYEDGVEEIRFRAGLVENDTQRAFLSAQKRQEALDKLAEQDIHEVKADGRVLLVDYKTGKTIADLGADRSGSGSGLSAAGLNSTINQIVGAFDNEPLVREYNTINTGIQYLKTLGSTPTDDIARIYQFAKIMDPNSAVREGEYATIQDYATALLERYGLKAKRVFDNSGFLTEEARGFLLGTLDNRLGVAKSQYDNVYNQYQGRIANAQAGGFNSLPDYSQTSFEQRFPPGSIVVDDETHIQYMIGADGISKTPIGSALPL